jgi:hypothetical protein
LNYALPPANAYLVFLEMSVCVLADDLSPKGLRANVLRHLTDLPATRQGGEHRLRKKLADASMPVPLEDKELIHPIAVRPDPNFLIDESEARVSSIDGGNKGMEAFRVPVAVERIAVLAMSVEILVPDVREVVLVELEHPLDR